MPDLGETLAKKLSKVPTVRQFTATFNYLTDEGRASITFDDRSTSTVPTVNSRPAPGERVRVIQVDAVTIMLGPARQRPSRGIINSVRTVDGVRTYALTLTSGETVPQMYSIGGALPVGARVAILWQDEGLILGQVNDPDPAMTVNGSPEAGGKFAGAADFAASWAGSYGTSWTADPLTVNATRTVAWGYGSKIADSIPRNATIDSVAVWLPLQSNTGDAVATIGRHTSATQPSGAVTINTPMPLPATNGWVELSPALIEALRTTNGGIAITRPAAITTGWQLAWSGIPADPQTGTLRVSWR